MSKICKGLFSVWIVYHLVVMILMPNGSSFLVRRSQSYLLPYANSIGLNATWNFFSPDPAHTMYFNYKVRFEDENGNETKPVFEGWFPPEKQAVIVDSSKRRFLYAVRFLLLDPKRLEVLFAPWLCREHPGSSKVIIQQITERIPYLDLALEKDLGQEMRTPVESQNIVYDCHKTQDEVAL